MTAKVRALSSVLGCVALMAALTQAGGADELPGGTVSASRPMPVAVVSTPTPSTTDGPTQNDAFVKYYTVGTGQDSPETLAAIAKRLLGTANRAEEIYQLNVGRAQPDGQALTESRQLRAGWSLIMPWDAIGDGVQVGQVPTGAPAGGTPSPPPPPAPPRSGPKSGPCANSLPTRTDAGWAQDRMTPDQAWGRTRGDGVLVAVVDSGVDGRTPALGGRVAVGADIPAGSGRGDIDCLGSGTAMASIIGARVPTTDERGTPLIGIAPEAMILPLRVVGETPQSSPADAATAIQVAVSAGARVIALGSFVDLSDAAVVAAVRQASDHDVVLVAPAPAASDASSAPTGPDTVLRVGGFGPEGQPAASYQPGGVDVAAPGIDVAAVGANGSGMRSGSGSQYAVAFVAGAAALVRSAYPDLKAAQVVNRIKATADHAGRTDPDPVTGWGMVNANAAVTTALAAEAKPAPRDGGGAPTGRILSVALLVVSGLAGAALLFRRPSRPEATGDTAATDPPAGPVVSATKPGGIDTDLGRTADRVRGVYHVDALPDLAQPGPVDDGIIAGGAPAGNDAQARAAATGTPGSRPTGSAARG
ncbi:subtilase family protein [Micromonospora violae]|uniref:Subtilase family protein n=1 Tax=Micromonospora violae TaxID=1278207 RepID=A0A4Q7UGV1_9ACTN|nr:S8 family serine peptidase [Micromonospora violae]RZT79461.1 subtilase family protein [Micromonospora violae]